MGSNNSTNNTNDTTKTNNSQSFVNNYYINYSNNDSIKPSVEKPKTTQNYTYNIPQYKMNYTYQKPKIKREEDDSDKVKISYSSLSNYLKVYSKVIEMERDYAQMICENKKENTVYINKIYSYYDQEKEVCSFTYEGTLIDIELTKGMIVICRKEEPEPCTFRGCITAYDKNLKYVEITPFTKKMEKIKEGKYSFKEEFCSVSFERMIEGLEIFCSKCSDRVDNTIRYQILNRPINSEIKSKIQQKLNELFNVKTKDPFVVNEIKGYYKLNENQTKGLSRIFLNNFNIIQGPPGTGKTALGSFIVLNILRNRKGNEKILVSTASNSASDNFAEKILDTLEAAHLNEEYKIIRLCSKSYESYGPESEKVQKISYHLIKNYKKALEEADVIICTCSTCMDDRIKDKFEFPFVIIDEVTQAMEPECLLPLINGSCHVTLLGDDKQLGPVVTHPEATKLKMNQSLFERLNQRKQINNYTLLTKQYRMHPKIVEFSNINFYESKLENGISEEHRYNEDYLRYFFNEPIVFVNVNGKEEKMSYGESKTNKEEAKMVSKIVNCLMNDCKVNPKDIGIITPYTAQIKEINKNLNNRQREQIEVASVDSFQGKEKDYIIISTVRSNTKESIGFLVEERRLNVMLTRAKYGMIIIGNAKTLYEAKEVRDRENTIVKVNKGEYTIWSKLIEFYESKGCLVEWGKRNFKRISLIRYH